MPSHASDRTARRLPQPNEGRPVDAAVPEESAGPGSRFALRNWSIRTRLISLLVLPVAAATGLGALRIESSLENVNQLDNMKLLTEMTDHATRLASALQEERDRSAGPLTGNGNPKDDSVVAPREETDRSKEKFIQATSGIEADDPVMAGVQSTVVDITRQLSTIKEIRERAYENPSYVSQTVNSYNQLIESLLSLSLDMAQATSNSEMIRSTRALAAFSSAKEYASIQRAVIAAGLARSGGPELSESDRLYAKTASESERAHLKSFNQIYGDGRAAELTKPLDGGIANVTSADQYADRVLKDPEGINSENRSYMDWYDQDRTKIDEMIKIEATLLSQMEQQASELRTQAQREAFLGGALILLVLGISLVGAAVVGRSMIRSLRRLQDTAQDIARKRLPELVQQLSEAEPQEVNTSVTSVGVHSRDEIGRVASAFDDVHREAVRLASEQALLRGNVNAMFTNLSRRSQGLIQRQLSLISELESREADPDQLSSLFKLDHLATRMRRNGENLLVLAGEEPGRRWTRPVPLVDVLRAAASEVEQYERIELNSVPNTEIAGRVVNDLVHLLAELLENATSFSSPQTKVKVNGHALPDGRVLVEIHDTGIGLSPEDLSAINDRLANPPTVDVSVSRRMGLFVVGRLSQRHGIRIQLRPSDSGGTTALVMLPVQVSQGSRGKPGPGGRDGGASLKREPQGNGAFGRPGGPGAAGRLGGLPTRQVGSGPTRAALPGQSDGGPGRLPTRGVNRSGGPDSGTGPGADSGSGSGSVAGSGPDTGSRGFPGAEQSATPTHGDGPSGAGTAAGGRGPRQASGLPSRVPGAGISSMSWGGQQQNRTPGRDAPDTARGHDDLEFTGPSRPDVGSPAPGGPEDTGLTPGFGSTYETGQYPALDTSRNADSGRQQPGRHAASGTPRNASRYPESSTDETGQYPALSAPRGTGGYPATDTSPANAGRYPDSPTDETGQYPTPDTARNASRYPESSTDETGQYPALATPQDTGHPVPAPEETGRYPTPDTARNAGRYPGFATDETGQYPALATPQDTGHPVPAPEQTGQYPTLGAHETGRLPALGTPQDTGQYAAPEISPETASTASGFPSPQSHWYDHPTAGTHADQQAATQPAEPSPSSQPSVSHPDLAAAGADAQAPQRGLADDILGTGSGPDDAAAPWAAAPNDERWRQAEQVRQPAAGGVTTSGLPRRVPRANLVAGTAQEGDRQHTGPQVSRAPADVRGRLTNLRRGIEQGRQAGATSSRSNEQGFSPTYQQER